jgi:uncharacterized protein with HEPN domain
LSRADDLRLDDIREAADRLAEIVGGGRDEFDRGWARQRATERLIEIIGEASNAWSEQYRSTRPSVPWRHIINLRHLLAHHYHRVDMEQLWTIATIEIPRLLAEINSADA